MIRELRFDIVRAILLYIVLIKVLQDPAAKSGFEDGRGNICAICIAYASMVLFSKALSLIFPWGVHAKRCRMITYSVVGSAVAAHIDVVFGSLAFALIAWVLPAQCLPMPLCYKRLATDAPRAMPMAMTTPLAPTTAEESAAPTSTAEMHAKQSDDGASAALSESGGLQKRVGSGATWIPSYRFLRPMTPKEPATEEERREEARLWMEAHSKDHFWHPMLGRCEFNFPAAFAPLPAAESHEAHVNEKGAGSTQAVSPAGSAKPRSKWRQEYEERQRLKTWYKEQQVKACRRMREWQDRVFGPDRDYPSM